MRIQFTTRHIKWFLFGFLSALGGFLVAGIDDNLSRPMFIIVMIATIHASVGIATWVERWMVYKIDKAKKNDEH